MPLSDRELRDLVRESVARHLGSDVRHGSLSSLGHASDDYEGRNDASGGAASDSHTSNNYASGNYASGNRAVPVTDAASRHPSHLVLSVASGGDEGDGLCLIEPARRCNHCGYCQSYGH